MLGTHIFLSKNRANQPLKYGTRLIRLYINDLLVLTTFYRTNHLNKIEQVFIKLKENLQTFNTDNFFHPNKNGIFRFLGYPWWCTDRSHTNSCNNSTQYHDWPLHLMVYFMTAITIPMFNISPILYLQLHSQESCDCNYPFFWKFQYLI